MECSSAAPSFGDSPQGVGERKHRLVECMSRRNAKKAEVDDVAGASTGRYPR